MYTVEIYRADRRRKSGERLVEKRDVESIEAALRLRGTRPATGEKRDCDSVDAAMAVQARPGYRVAVHETWVTRENFLSGKPYQERYDTPRHCSPSSELYWSM